MISNLSDDFLSIELDFLTQCEFIFDKVPKDLSPEVLSFHVQGLNTLLSSIKFHCASVKFLNGRSNYEDSISCNDSK